MSRHLISAAHGRTTEIPNGLIYHVAKSKSAEKDFVSLESSRDVAKRLERRSTGRFGATDIPLLSMSIYMFR